MTFRKSVCAYIWWHARQQSLSHPIDSNAAQMKPKAYLFWEIHQQFIVLSVAGSKSEWTNSLTAHRRRNGMRDQWPFRRSETVRGSRSIVLAIRLLIIFCSDGWKAVAKDRIVPSRRRTEREHDLFAYFLVQIRYSVSNTFGALHSVKHWDCHDRALIKTVGTFAAVGLCYYSRMVFAEISFIDYLKNKSLRKAMILYLFSKTSNNKIKLSHSIGGRNLGHASFILY